MEFNFSEELDPVTYRDDGLAHGIPLRIHKDPFKEIAGAIRAQKDWSYHVSPVSDYLGGLGQPFSFIRVTIPECLPERLEVMSYANEYAFLYDGMHPMSLRLPDANTSRPNGESGSEEC